MKKIQSIFLAFIALALLIAPLLLATKNVGANSYYGGNGRLVFYSPVTLDSSEQEIYTVKPDGTDLKRVTNNSLADANPQWAPSGDKIAYDHYVNGSQQQDIYIQNINPDGSANGSPTVVSGANTTVREFDPSWNPAGDKIAYHRCMQDVDDEDEDEDITECNSPYQIFAIDSSGGFPTRITTDEDYTDTEPTWRRDGEYLAFSHRNIDTGISHVGVSAATGGGVTTISPGNAPQWSPVADKVVFGRDGELWTYDQAADDADGTGPSDNLTQLTTGATITSAPTWSPDGKIIAASSSSNLRYYNATTGAVVANTILSTNVDLGYDSSNSANELDWARAALPPSTEHECTTYVNEDCADFEPEIPTECQDVSTQAQNGVPKFEDDAFLYTPNEGFVGEDRYVYEYFDENMNTISCTVNITVLPRAPSTGNADPKNILYVLASVGVVGVVGLGFRRLKFGKFL